MVPDQMHPARRMLAGESGAALIETALVIPVLLVLLAGIVMTGRVAHAQIAVQSVAREAARTLAVAPSASEGLASAQQRALAAASGHGLAIERLALSIDAGAFDRGGVVQAEATYPVTLGDLPLLGTFEVTVSSRQEARVDLYRSRTLATP